MADTIVGEMPSEGSIRGRISGGGSINGSVNDYRGDIYESALDEIISTQEQYIAMSPYSAAEVSEE